MLLGVVEWEVTLNGASNWALVFSLKSLSMLHGLDGKVPFIFFICTEAVQRERNVSLRHQLLKEVPEKH